MGKFTSQLPAASPRERELIAYTDNLSSQVTRLEAHMETLKRSLEAEEFKVRNQALLVSKLQRELRELRQEKNPSVHVIL